MVEQESDWLARSLCSDVSRKALWEARWGGESRAGWKFYLLFFFFFLRFHSHLDNQGLKEGK